MKLLLLIALKNKKHLLLLLGTLFSMVCLTAASQMEMGAVGIMASKGPDFFELFAPLDKGKLQPTDTVALQEIEHRWNQIDVEGKGYVSQTDVTQYLAAKKRHNVVEKLISWLDDTIGISKHVSHLALLLVAIALFKAVSLFCHRFCTRLVSIRVSRDLRLQYFEHLQSMPLTFYNQYNVGSLSSRVVSDAFSIAEAINSTLINYLQTPITLASTLALCFMTSWQLSLIVFFGLPLILFPMRFLSRKTKTVAKQLQHNQEHFASVIIDYLSGIQTVKAFAMEDFSLKKYTEHNDRVATLERRGARYDLASRPIVHTIAMFFLATTMLYGLYVAKMSVGELFFFCGLLYLFYEPIKKFAEENNSIQRGVAAAERMVEVTNLQAPAQERPGAVPFVDLKETIEFKDVWFRYGEPWILKGLSFTLRKGETVAIVGPTGAGKSTIVQLLPRLYDIERGEILIDGKPIDAYVRRSLREGIAFVPQRPFLFLDTVRANIAYGRGYSLEQIQEAARKAYADEFIVGLPQGYDTPLQEAGKNLSGGQQQRLAIARALVKEAPILVFDEATSALDMLSEQRIKSAIQDLKGKTTQIIIAHRLATIEGADRIIYLDQGVKVAEGTRDELLRSCDSFRAMWHARGIQEPVVCEQRP